MSKPAPSCRSTDAIRCVVFDLDGTLLDIGNLFDRVFNTFLSRMDLEPIRFERKGDPWTSAYRQTVSQYAQIAGQVGRVEFDEAWADVLAGMLAAGEVRLYDGALQTLRQLRAAGRTLCLASNTPKRFVEVKLSHFALRELFAFVCTPQDAWGPKPNPRSLYEVMKAFQLSPHEVLMVGDHAQDMEYGRNAGVRTAAVLYGYGDRAEMERVRPDILLHEISDVVEIVSHDGESFPKKTRKRSSAGI